MSEKHREQAAGGETSSDRGLLMQIGLGILVVVTLVLVIHLVENRRGERAWQRVETRLVAAGENLDCDVLIKRLTVMPPEAENFGAHPLIRALVTPGSDPANEARMVALKLASPGDLGPGWELGKVSPLLAKYRKAMEADGVVASEATDAEWVRDALSVHAPVLAELEAASRRPHARFIYDPSSFSVDFADFATLSVPHYMQVLEAIRTLALLARADLAAGAPAAALRHLRLAGRLCDLVAGDPLLLAQVVGFAGRHVILSVAWEGLRTRAWQDEASLAYLVDHLGGYEPIEPWLDAMRLETLVMSAGAMDYLKEESKPWKRGTSGSPSGLLSGRTNRVFDSLLTAVPDGWFDQNRARAVGLIFEGCIIPLRDGDFGRLRGAEKAIGAAFGRRTPYNLGAGMLVPAYGKLAKRLIVTLARARLAAVAAALERHRLAHGRLPRDLVELGLPAAVMEDPMLGVPMHYRLVPSLAEEKGDADRESYILYVDGWDMHDGGGRVVIDRGGRMDTEHGDIVWSYSPVERIEAQ
jgi:hypothetical protein